MFIKSADIYNYRGIEKLNVEFREGINLLIGDNGTGKTSLLSAISIVLNEVVRKITGYSITKLSSSDAYQTTLTVGGTVVDTKTHYPIKINSEVIHHENQYRCTIIKESEESPINSKTQEVNNLLNLSMKSESEQLPILCFLPAQRGKLKKSETQVVKLSNNEPQRKQAYDNALSERSDLDVIQQWCVQMEFSEYQKKQKIKEYSSYQSVVSRFASLMDEKAKGPKVYYSSEKPVLFTLTVKTKRHYSS